LEIKRLNGFEFPSLLAASDSSVTALTGVYELSDVSEFSKLGFRLAENFIGVNNMFYGVDFSQAELPQSGGVSQSATPSIPPIFQSASPSIPSAGFLSLFDPSLPLPAEKNSIPELDELKPYLNYVTNFGGLLTLMGMQKTVNFSNGFPTVGTPVALAENGMPLNEVVITDYLAYTIARRLNDALFPNVDLKVPKSGEPLREFLNSGFEASLARYFNILNAADGYSSNLRIVGILDTGYKTAFFDQLTLSSATLTKEYLRYVYCVENYYLMLYSAEGFANSCYRDRLLTTNYHYSTYNEGILKAYAEQGLVRYAAGYDYAHGLSAREIVMSENAFILEFGYAFDGIKKTVGAPFDNVDFTGFTVVGVVNNGVGTNRFARNFAVVLADADVGLLVNSLSYRIGIHLSVKNSDAYELFDFMEKRLICYASVYSALTARTAPMITNMRDIFVPLTVIIAIVAVITLAMFLITAVTKNQKEIGIMKALGMKTRDVVKIYLIESAVTMLSVLLFSSLFIYLFYLVANQILAGELQRFVRAELLSQITVLYLTFLPFLIDALAILGISLISVLYPILKITKMSPMEAVRKSE
jgi:hypothetical protein